MNADPDRVLQPASQDPQPPEGFVPLFRSSAFLDLVGPLFYRAGETSFRVGMRVLARHTNSSGAMHGGLMATLADVSLGYVTAESRKPALRMSTASLSIDYLAGAALGTWVEAAVAVDKVGRQLAFANAVITADGKTVARAKALFAVVQPEPSAAHETRGER